MGKYLWVLQPTARAQPSFSQGAMHVVTCSAHTLPMWHHLFGFDSHSDNRCSLPLFSEGWLLSGLEFLHVDFFLMPSSSQFRSPCFRWRYCCSSWMWREGQAPGVRCCPELFEHGALGRGRWPAAAHPCGLPCDKPGNVEWRPATELAQQAHQNVYSAGDLILLGRSAVYQKHTFASVVTVGLGGKCTSVAFKMVFSWRISCCDRLWPNGWNIGGGRE